MKRFLPLLTSVLFLSCHKNDSGSGTPVLREAVYNNGELSTGTVTDNGVTAQAGYQWSEAQHNAAATVSNNFTGFACGYRTGDESYYKAADDFTVPAGQQWNVSKISVYVISNAGSVSNPFDALRIQLWKGDPSVAGSTVVYGDMTENRLSSGLDARISPIQNSSVPAPGIPPTSTSTTWKLSASVTVSLPAGVYWLVYQVHRSDNTICYSPPVKVKGYRGLPGWNAIVFNSLFVWQRLIDVGNPVTMPYEPQDIPFELVYKF